ncbi:MAG: 8-amino-3,8-dideoxy-alpha-D-manno-octulosonate transaminase [Patescibacteria group bacterium]|nr:8-amino-3,8-dideoxy-alpha-D-manno-octulosonate transaminase [Patescibacteria group bacterium]
MSKLISVSLSPNTQKDDVSLAFKLIFSTRKGGTKKLERLFRNYFGFRNAFAFNSGRSSLIAILKAMEIKKGDEVIMQSFTCNAAVNPIRYVGATPIFADIDENLNISLDDLKKKITPKTKAIMVQHTFGNPARIDEIKEICSEKKIYLIEDCAHSLGAMYKGEFCGFFGDASFFSFGRDKVISSVYGGMVTINNELLIDGVSSFQKELKNPSVFWTIQQLLHPVLLNKIILPLYNMKIGRMIMALFLNLNILSKAVTKKEGIGILPKYFPKKMPSSLSYLAINQLKKLEDYNNHRREVAQYYNHLFLKGEIDSNNIYLKYPLFVDNPSEIINKLRKHNIYINDGWSGSPIVPPSTELDKVCYKLGSCPKAEEISKKIILLPTHINISKKDAKKVFDCLENIRQNR